MHLSVTSHFVDSVD